MSYRQNSRKNSEVFSSQDISFDPGVKVENKQLDQTDIKVLTSTIGKLNNEEYGNKSPSPTYIDGSKKTIKDESVTSNSNLVTGREMSEEARINGTVKSESNGNTEMIENNIDQNEEDIISERKETYNMRKSMSSSSTYTSLSEVNQSLINENEGSFNESRSSSVNSFKTSAIDHHMNIPLYTTRKSHESNPEHSISIEHRAHHIGNDIHNRRENSHTKTSHSPADVVVEDGHYSHPHKKYNDHHNRPLKRHLNDVTSHEHYRYSYKRGPNGHPSRYPESEFPHDPHHNERYYHGGYHPLHLPIDGYYRDHRDRQMNYHYHYNYNYGLPNSKWYEGLGGSSVVMNIIKMIDIIMKELKLKNQNHL